jgi:hypothetical protein
VQTVEAGQAGRLLFERLKVGFENPDRVVGVCQFELAGEGTRSFYLTFRERELDYSEGTHPEPVARVGMPLTLAMEIAVGDNVDMRDPRNLDQIDASGDVRLLAILSQLTKVPNRDAKERFKDAEERGRKLPRIREVERITVTSKEQVAERMAAGLPIIIMNGLSKWKEAFSWTFHDIKRKFGHLSLRSNLGESTLGEFLEQLNRSTEGEVPYTFGCPMPKELADLFEPPFFEKESFGIGQLWMGSAAGHVSTYLHRDSGDAFLGQIIGRKQFILFSPDQTEYMYAFKSFNRDQPCWVNAWEPNYETYPLFKHAVPTEFTLLPGDLLIIPRGWYHTVKALDPTLSVGFHREPVSDFGRILSQA